MLCSNTAAVWGSRREEIVCTSLWPGFFSVIEYTSSYVRCFSCALVNELVLCVKISFSDGDNCEVGSVVPSKEGRIVTKSSFSDKTAVGVLICFCW